MATNDFRHVELYGGAMTVNLPSGFADVSDIRPVPDHQEIYLSSTGFASIIFDLAERVSHLLDDEEALIYHFEDIVNPGDNSKVWQSYTIHLAQLASTTPALTLVASTAPPLPTENPVAPATTTILMTLVRLVYKSTDLVITINLPHIPGQVDTSTLSAASGPLSGQGNQEDVDFAQGIFGSWVEEGMRVRDEVLRTLTIKDWGLFGDDERQKQEDIQMEGE